MCVPDHLTQNQLCLTSRCRLCLRVDYASEMSGLAKNPILVQSSTAMLAQANMGFTEHKSRSDTLVRKPVK
ncbi:TPA: hypothetical protein EYO57_14745 [Candidatus Poribacteria bacterium]|nr:hypothetical protein [Candidatus Poribacteria bacterium]